MSVSINNIAKTSSVPIKISFSDKWEVWKGIIICFFAIIGEDWSERSREKTERIFKTVHEERLLCTPERTVYFKEVMNYLSGAKTESSEKRENSFTIEMSKQISSKQYK